jgi:hypothetical protein
MMELYRRAMMNKYSSIQYPFGTGRTESATAEPAFIPRRRTPGQNFQLRQSEEKKSKPEIKTVITETDDDSPNKKVTTITGGLMGDVPFDYGQDDDQPTQVQPGTDFFGGDVTDRNTERAIVLAARKRKFLEREAQELAARQKMREQTGGAAPSQEAVEGALERYARMRESQLTPQPSGISSPQRARTRLPQEDSGTGVPSKNLWQSFTDSLSDVYGKGGDLEITPGTVSLSPGSSRMTGVEEVAKEGIQKRIDQIRSSTLPGRDDEQIAQVDPRIVALNQPPVPAGIPFDYGQDDPTGAAYGGRFETGSEDAVIRGMIEDSKKHARSKQRAESGYPARDEFSEFATQDKGMLHYLLNPLEKPPATKLGDSAYANTMITDQKEREVIAKKRLKETGSEHPTLQERLGLTEEAFRWKGKNFQKEQEEKEAAIKEDIKEKVDMGLPSRIAEDPDVIGELPSTKKQIDADVAQANANENLWQAWGDFVRKPGERKEAYMKNLSDIFRKAMIMNAVAQLTGGTSQADAYVKFATGKLDAIEKFDQEDRLQSAWKSIMFNEDGTFNPPSGYGEALERAAKLGVSPKESKAFSALFPKAATSKFWVFDTKAKKNIRITDDQYTKDDGRYTAVADAGGRATSGQLTDIPYYFNDDGVKLTAEEQADVMEILNKPHAIPELWKKYPKLMRRYKEKEDSTTIDYNTAINALVNQSNIQNQKTQEDTGSQEGSQTPRKPVVESVEDV